jgi:hypothetical protein
MSESLTPGVLDGAAERAFSYGACAGLALALHDATGWQLVKLTDADSVYDPHGGDYVDRPQLQRGHIGSAGMGAGGLHWAVERPDGMLIDVDGAHTLGELIDRYSGEGDQRSQGQVAAGRTDREDAIDEYVEAKGAPVPLTMAASFVEPVLDRAGR